MQNVRNLFLFLLMLTTVSAGAQESAVIRAYINTYKDIAIAEMQRTGVPASIKLAQGIHETLAGTSVLVKKSNNHFGIKCKANWTGESVSHTDDAPNECFRKYPESGQSYRDHSDFLRANVRYASLFNLDPLDYTGWAYGLKRAGYATNPKYPQVIIRLVEEYNLQDYSLMALGKMPMPEETQFAAAPVPPVDAPVVIPEPAALRDQALYPPGEFRINNTRVIFAPGGTSLLAIAQQYRVPLKRLIEYNEMEEVEMLPAARLIYLQRKRKNGFNDFHVVTGTESLKDIASVEAIRLESLLEYNHLNEQMIPAPGERLYLRQKAPATPRLITSSGQGFQAQASNDTKEIINYTVAPRETLYAIAKKYDVKVEQIISWNGLDSRTLRAGQQLKIYK